MPADRIAAAPGPEPMELWCAYPDDLLDAPTAAACSALLNEEETARWQRLRFEANRREFLATHALVRSALSRHQAPAPAAWRFRMNSHGKPETDPACGISFNLSNALGMVVCLIARGAEVGVDVEPEARADEILPLAPDVFSAEEQAELEALPAAARAGRALSLWTLKEAYIKARGMGLALPLGRFSFRFGGQEGIYFETDAGIDAEPGRWRYRMLDHAGHRIALMVAVPSDPSLELWETRFGAEPPRPIALLPDPWFPRPAKQG